MTDKPSANFDTFGQQHLGERETESGACARHKGGLGAGQVSHHAGDFLGVRMAGERHQAVHGGGVRAVADIRKLLLCGADKVSINSAAVKDPSQATLALPMLCFPAVLFSGAILPVHVMADAGVISASGA